MRRATGIKGGATDSTLLISGGAFHPAPRDEGAPAPIVPMAPKIQAPLGRTPLTLLLFPAMLGLLSAGCASVPETPGWRAQSSELTERLEDMSRAAPVRSFALRQSCERGGPTVLAGPSLRASLGVALGMLEGLREARSIHLSPGSTPGTINVDVCR